MGTRADYYIGRGKDAKWLCSTAWDGDPDGMSDDLLDATTEDAFIGALAAHCETRNDVTVPADGWPWPWEDSNTTDYAYALDEDQVWVSCFGRGWATTEAWREYRKLILAWNKRYRERDNEDPEDPRPTEPGTEEKTCIFPNMEEIQNVTFGPRSGVVVLSVPKSDKHDS